MENGCKTVRFPSPAQMRESGPCCLPSCCKGADKGTEAVAGVHAPEPATPLGRRACCPARRARSAPRALPRDALTRPGQALRPHTAPQATGEAALAGQGMGKGLPFPNPFLQTPVAKLLQSCPNLRTHGLLLTKFLCLADSPGKDTGVGCHFLLHQTP